MFGSLHFSNAFQCWAFFVYKLVSWSWALPWFCVSITKLRELGFFFFIFCQQNTSLRIVHSIAGATSLLNIPWNSCAVKSRFILGLSVVGRGIWGWAYFSWTSKDVQFFLYGWEWLSLVAQCRRSSHSSVSSGPVGGKVDRIFPISTHVHMRRCTHMLMVSLFGTSVLESSIREDSVKSLSSLIKKCKTCPWITFSPLRGVPGGVCWEGECLYLQFSPAVDKLLTVLRSEILFLALLRGTKFISRQIG